MKKNKIYFTKDVIEEVKKLGYNEEFVVDFYYFLAHYLRERVKNTDQVAYFFPKFGTVYLTLTGVNYTLKILESSKYNGEKKKEILENLRKQKVRIEENIKKLKESGNNSIAYFGRVFNPRYIKNKDDYE